MYSVWSPAHLTENLKWLYLQEIGRSTNKSSLKDYSFNTGVNKFLWMKLQRTRAHKAPRVGAGSRQKPLKAVSDRLSLCLWELLAQNANPASLVYIMNSCKTRARNKKQKQQKRSSRLEKKLGRTWSTKI